MTEASQDRELYDLPKIPMSQRERAKLHIEEIRKTLADKKGPASPGSVTDEAGSPQG